MRIRDARRVDGYRLDDYRSQVHPDGRSLRIPKDWIAGVSPAWIKQSCLSELPKLGSKGGYRNGHYHAHEMGDRWEMHWDFFDPNEHPICHFLSDARSLAIPVCIVCGIVGTGYFVNRLRKDRRECAVKEFVLFTGGLTLAANGVLTYILWLQIRKPRKKQGISRV